MYYVHILKNKSGNLYVGYTNDLIRRFEEHQKEDKYQLIYYEAYLSSKITRQRETKLKYHGSAWRALRKRIDA